MAFSPYDSGVSTETHSRYLLDPNLTPCVKEFLKKINAGKGVETLPLQAARQSLITLQDSTKVDLSGITISTQVIEGISCDVIRPKKCAGYLPMMVFIHGGGWVIGSPGDHMKLVRDLVCQNGHMAIVPSYSLSPEVKFPIALDQCTSVTKWLKVNGRSLQGNPDMLCVVGNSAGGNMTIGVAAALGKDITCAVAMWPVSGIPGRTQSWSSFGIKRYLTFSAMKWFWNNYIVKKDEYKDPRVVPLSGTKEYFKNMPPLLIQVAENDILRDEGERLGRLLSNYGCCVATLRYRGMIHDWALFNALSHTVEHQTLITTTAGFMNFYCMQNCKYTLC